MLAQSIELVCALTCERRNTTIVCYLLRVFWLLRSDHYYIQLLHCIACLQVSAVCPCIAVGMHAGPVAWPCASDCPRVLVVTNNYSLVIPCAWNRGHSFWHLTMSISPCDDTIKSTTDAMYSMYHVYVYSYVCKWVIYTITSIIIMGLSLCTPHYWFYKIHYLFFLLQSEHYTRCIY